MRRSSKAPFFAAVTLGLATLVFSSTIEASAFPSEQAEPLAPIIRVRRALNRIKPFKVIFLQQVYTDREMDFQESGDIIFNHHRQLKWTYKDPDYKVFLLEGDNYKYYDEDNEQLMTGRVKEKNRQWIWRLLFSDEVLPHTRWNQSESLLHVTNPKESLDIKINVDKKWLPRKVTQLDPSGARMVFIFKQYQEKIPVDEETFKLKVPQNVEIIQDDK